MAINFVAEADKILGVQSPATQVPGATLPATPATKIDFLGEADKVIAPSPAPPTVPTAAPAPPVTPGPTISDTAKQRLGVLQQATARGEYPKPGGQVKAPVPAELIGQTLVGPFKKAADYLGMRGKPLVEPMPYSPPTDPEQKQLETWINNAIAGGLNIPSGITATPVAGGTLLPEAFAEAASEAGPAPEMPNEFYVAKALLNTRLAEMGKGFAGYLWELSKATGKAIPWGVAMHANAPDLAYKLMEAGWGPEDFYKIVQADPVAAAVTLGSFAGVPPALKTQYKRFPKTKAELLKVVNKIAGEQAQEDGVQPAPPVERVITEQLAKPTAEEPKPPAIPEERRKLTAPRTLVDSVEQIFSSKADEIRNSDRTFVEKEQLINNLRQVVKDERARLIYDSELLQEGFNLAEDKQGWMQKEMADISGQFDSAISGQYKRREPEIRKTYPPQERIYDPSDPYEEFYKKPPENPTVITKPEEVFTTKPIDDVSSPSNVASRVYRAEESLALDHDATPPSQPPKSAMPPDVSPSIMTIEEGIRGQVEAPTITTTPSIHSGSKTEPYTVIKRSDILKKIKVTAKSVIDKGRIRNPLVKGLYYLTPHAIRLRFTKDLPTAFHEMAHAIEGFIWPANMFSKNKKWRGDVITSSEKWAPEQLKLQLGDALGELAAAYKPEEVLIEGFAEFVRMFVTDRQAAEKVAPDFYQHFTEKLSSSPQAKEIGLQLDELSTLWRMWRDQPASAKIFSNMSIGGYEKRPLTLARVYQGLINRENIYERAMQAMMGEVIHGPGSFTTAAIAFRGWADQALLWLQNGRFSLHENPLSSYLLRFNRLNDDVLQGKQPIHGVNEPLIIENYNISNEISRAMIPKLERLGLIEIRETRAGDAYYVTPAGKAMAENAFAFGKTGESLRDILEIVKDPEPPFYTPNDSKSALRAWFNTGDRWKTDSAQFNAFRVYWAAEQTKWLYQRELLKHPELGEKVIKDNVWKMTGNRVEDARIASEEMKGHLGKMDTGEFKAEVALKKITEYNDALLMELAAEGIITTEELKRIKLANIVYMPLRRVFDVVTPPPIGQGQGVGGGQKVGLHTKPIKARHGSDLDIIDPLESTVFNTYTMVNAIRRNQIKRYLHEWGETVPGSGAWVRPLPPKSIPTSFNLREIRKTIKDTIIKEATDSLLEQAKNADDPTTLKNVEETIDTFKSMMDDLPLDQLARIYRPEKFVPKIEGAVAYWRDGKPVFLKVHPDLYSHMLNLDASSSGILLRFLGANARLLRAGVTLWPEWMITNFIRDTFQAAVYHKGGLSPFDGFVPLIDSLIGAKDYWTMNDWYFKYKASGAGMNTSVYLDRNYLQSGLTKLLGNEDLLSKVKNVPRHPIEAMRILAELSETSTRLGNYRKYAKQYGTDQNGLLKAMVESRDGTIDFAQVGNWTQEWIHTTAFLSSFINGWDKFGRTIIRSIKDPDMAMKFTTRLATYVLFPSLVSYLATRNHPDRKRIAAWEKDLFWLMPFGGQLYKFPKPYDIGVLFGSGLERMLEYMDSQDPRVLDEYGNSVLQTLSPTVVPNMLATYIAVVANKDYRGRPIVPLSEQLLDANLQRKYYTSNLARLISWASDYIPGAGKGWSPYKIDYAIRGLTGATGKEAAGSLDAILAALAKDTRFGKAYGVRSPLQKPNRLSTAPFVRKFVVNPETKAGGLIEQFYKEYSKANQAYQSFANNPPETAEEMLDDPTRRMELASYYALSTTADTISSLWAAREKAVEDSNWDEVDRIYGQIITAMEDGLNDAKVAQEDPRNLQAVRMDRELKAMRIQEGADRFPIATSIQDLVERESWEDLKRFLNELTPTQKQWAVPYARKLMQRSKLTPTERVIKKAPKVFRPRLKELENAE